VAALCCVASLAFAQAPAAAPAPAVEETGPKAPEGELGRSQLGGVGLAHVQSAAFAPLSLGASAQVGFFRTEALTAPGGTDEYHLTQMGAYITPLDWLEIAVAARSATLTQPASSKGYYFLVNDLFLRAKVGMQPVPGMYIAAQLGLRIPPPAFSSQPFYAGLSPFIGGLFTYDFKRVGIPILFHVNTSFTLDNSVDFDDGTADASRRFALGINTYNRWTTALAAEARFDAKGFGIRPFVEYEIDASLGAQGTPMKVIPGLRLLPWRRSFVDFAVELGVSKSQSPGVLPVPPWQLQIGLGYQIDLAATGGETRIVERVVEKEKKVQVQVAGKPVVRSTIVGVVRDEKTMKPLKDAIVTGAGKTRMLTGDKGEFNVGDLDAGPVKVSVTLPGYAPGEFQGVLKQGEKLELDLTLEPLPPAPPPPVKVRGTVMSEKDKPIAATVSAPGAGVSLKAGANGEYETTVPEGDQSIEAGAAGFLTQGRTVHAKSGETVVLDFVLKEVPKATLVVLTKEKIEIKKQVHFATDKDVILPDSAPLLDEVAATILEHDRLKMIRIEGHTDSQGDDAHNLDLSNRRAASVMRALLERGIQPTRLKAIGYGETRPVGDNKTAKGRALNRRVEFMIEEQE
jgi:outer membrane protein OmpA-like peptidoglycan-associated protein